MLQSNTLEISSLRYDYEVPQDSFLGPLPYNLYFANIATVLASSGVPSHLNADNSYAYLSSISRSNCSSHNVAECMHGCFKWKYHCIKHKKTPMDINPNCIQKSTSTSSRNVIHKFNHTRGIITTTWMYIAASFRQHYLRFPQKMPRCKQLK